jgi:hypothetical protein
MDNVDLDRTSTGNSLAGVTLVSGAMDVLFLEDRSNNWPLLFLLRDAARAGAQVIVTDADTQHTADLLLASDIYADGVLVEDLESKRFKILSNSALQNTGETARFVFDNKAPHYMPHSRHISILPDGTPLHESYDRIRQDLGLRPFAPAVFILFPEPPTPI